MVVRIIHMIGSLDIGGSQTMIMNIYRKIDRNRIQFDFIVDHSDQLYFKEEIEKLMKEYHEEIPEVREIINSVDRLCGTGE